MIFIACIFFCQKLKKINGKIFEKNCYLQYDATFPSSKNWRFVKKSHNGLSSLGELDFCIRLDCKSRLQTQSLKSFTIIWKKGLDYLSINVSIYLRPCLKVNSNWSKQSLFQMKQYSNNLCRHRHILKIVDLINVART